MTSSIVFFDVAGPDDQQLRQFYSNVFGWGVTDQSKFKVSEGEINVSRGMYIFGISN